MNIFLINIMLAFVWLFITAELNSANFIFGFVISYFILWMRYRKTGKSYFIKGPAIVSLVVYFTVQALISAFEVAYSVIAMGKTIQPGIISFKSKVSSDLELVSLSGLITLTPGTLVVEYEEENNILYVHLLNINNETRERRNIKKIEKKVIKALGDLKTLKK